MNKMKMKANLVFGIALAMALALFSTNKIIASDSQESMGTPETCPDYHQYSAPASLDTSTFNNGAPRWSEVRVDAQGFYHIAFQSTGNVLKYGTNKGGIFLSEQPVASGQDPFGWAPSVAVDSNSKVHIVYGYGPSGGPSRLYYITNASGSWSQPYLISTTTWGQSSLAFDRNGVLHLLYQDGTSNHPLQYTTWNGSSWSTPAVVDSGDALATNTYPILAFNSNNKAIFSYQEYASGTYSLWWGQMNANGTDIQHTQLVAEILAGSLSMALDNQGASYVSYLVMDYGNKLSAMTNRGGTWSDLLQQSSFYANYSGYGTSIGANADGTIFIAYPTQYPSMVVIPVTTCAVPYVAQCSTQSEFSNYPRVDAVRSSKAHVI